MTKIVGFRNVSKSISLGEGVGKLEIHTCKASFPYTINYIII